MCDPITIHKATREMTKKFWSGWTLAVKICNNKQINKREKNREEDGGAPYGLFHQNFQVPIEIIAIRLQDFYCPTCGAENRKTRLVFVWKIVKNFKFGSIIIYKIDFKKK